MEYSIGFFFLNLGNGEREGGGKNGGINWFEG